MTSPLPPDSSPWHAGEKQLPVEIAVLVGHVVADHPAAEYFHALGHACTFLQLLFPGVPGR